MKIFEKGELKLLWPFYLESFTAYLLYFLPAFMVLYLSKLNFSFLQIGILFSITPLSALLFEIPTGAIADLYGRKFSVITGYFIEGICMFLLFFVKSYYLILFIFLIWGIGATFSSGSKDAWIVDMINKKNKKLIHNFFTKMQIFINLGLVLSGLLGVVATRFFGLKIIWMVSAFSYLLSIFLLSFFTSEFYEKKKINLKKSFFEVKNQSIKTIKYGYKHPVLFNYLLATSLFAIAGTLSAVIPWTSLLKELNFPDYYFGYMWSMMSFIAIIAPIVSSKLLKKGKEKKFIIYSICGYSLLTLFILFPKYWISALILLGSLTFFYSLKIPALEVYFHRFIDEKIRATMGSVRSIMIYLGGIIGGVLTGYLIDIFGSRYTIILSVPISILALILFIKIKENKT